MCVVIFAFLYLVFGVKLKTTASYVLQDAYTSYKNSRLGLLKVLKIFKDISLNILHGFNSPTAGLEEKMSGQYFYFFGVPKKIKSEGFFQKLQVEVIYVE